MTTATAPSTATAAPSALLRPGAPAALPLAPPHELHVTIVGELLEHAHVAVEPATGRAALSVTLGQGQGMPAVLATLWLGDGPEAMQLAHDRARTLLRGDVVTVHGDTLRMRYHHDALAISVAHVRRIEPLPHHAAACAKAAARGVQS